MKQMKQVDRVLVEKKEEKPEKEEAPTPAEGGDGVPTSPEANVGKKEEEK